MNLLDKDTIAETFNGLDRPYQVAKFTIQTTTEQPIQYHHIENPNEII